jgi:arginyl-tRNA synthetase
MNTLLHLLQKEVSHAIQTAFGLTIQAEIVHCAEQFGHYQCNSALPIAKEQKMAPRMVAQKMIDEFSPTLKAMCAKIEIAGPGFINFTLSPLFLSHELQQQLTDSHLGATPFSTKQKIVVDFSSPNVAKELHVGHIRSTIIGDSLCRLFEFLGAEVLRLNHIGDWGTQFGMLITYMKQHVPDVLSGQQQAGLDSLMTWYKESKKQFDSNPEFQKRSQRQVVELQAGAPDAIKAWEMICEISQKGFEEIYRLLNVRIIHRGESFYNPMLKGIVEELEQKGLVTLSEGAKCIFLEGYKIPLMIQKSDGGYNYDTTDMAAMRHRILDEKANRIIIVTDNGQALHFQLVIAAAQKAGWLDPSKTQVDHVGFGLVLGQDGKKFKTRSGETERLIDLLTEGISEAETVLKEKMPDSSPSEIKHLAHIIGIDAIKYSDLATHRTKDYTFSYEKMLRFEGNTAVFLLYAYVRINGIKRKATLNPKAHLHLQHPSEISLAVHLRRFGEILESVAKDLLPNRLAEYLYDLAGKFNAFYRDCPIINTPEQDSRLLLAELTAKVLKQGLEILGLETVDRM